MLAMFAYQHDSRQATQSTVRLPGYTLQLSPNIADSALSPSLLEGMGLGPGYCPSHLEYVQAVDVATVSSFWQSPLRYKLYPKICESDIATVM